MVKNLKPASTNYKLRTTNYKVKGALHDGKNLRATVPFLPSADGFKFKGFRYKLRTTSYKVKGISHDGISLRATMAPYYKCGEKNGIINYLCYKFGKGVFHGYDKEDSRYAGGVLHDVPVGGWCDVPSR